MRRRILIALTVFAAVAVLGFAVPLALTVATSRTQQLVLARSGDADRFATLADAAAGDRRALADEVQRYHELYGDNVLVVDARGATAVNAGVDSAAPDIAATVAAARRNQRPSGVRQLSPWGPAQLLIARPVGTGVQVNGVVVIEASTRHARGDIARLWLLTALGAVVAMVVCTLLALTVSRWVLRPLAALSAAVAELTATLPRTRNRSAAASSAPVDSEPGEISARGAPSITRRHGGPPEMRAVAESFDAMAVAVADSVDAQRQLVADTAHAMRNPLAALTIRLDSLAPTVPTSAVNTFRGASAEVERLTALLDGLLGLAAAETPNLYTAAEGRCDANQVAADRYDAWSAAYTAMDQRLRLAVSTPVEAPVAADVLAQILDVPLSNSMRYAGAGATTTIRVAVESHRALVSVVDDGVGVDPAELDKLAMRFFRGSGAAAGGSGLGLPIAVALARAHGARVWLESVVPHGLAFHLSFEEGRHE